MKQSSWWLWILSVVLVIACVAMPFMPSTTLPFDTYSGGGGKIVIKASSLDFPLPADLKPGDVIRDDQMDIASRAYLNAGDNDPPGTQIRLVVERDGQLLHVPVQVVRIPHTLQFLLLQGAFIALTWLEVALGLLILWRGRHRAALGIAIWCLTDAVSTIARSIPTPAPAGDYIGFAVYFLFATPLQLYGLFLVADGLTSEIAAAWRRWIMRAFFLALMAYVAVVWIDRIPYVATGYERIQEFYGIFALHIVCFAIPIAVLLLAYRSVSMATRLRIRWVFLSLLMLVSSYSILAGIFFGIKMPPLLYAWLQSLFTGAALCGFTYAVLRHQLVPVRWVVNRALAYAIVTSLVVSLFALVLSFMQHTALGAGNNRVVALLIALLLGMGLNAVKRRLDFYLNRLFFRHERRARSAFNKFIRMAADITDRKVLLDRAADELFNQSRARGLSFYLAEGKNQRMVRVCERGDMGSPPRIDAHDPGLLQLKAGDKWINLQTVKSALGTEGHVFPMRVGQQLIGLVVCGPRMAGQRISEELKLLASVTLRIAALIYTLETSAQRDLLLCLANGEIQANKEVQSRAKALVGIRAKG
jgi:hypothetical protein